MQTKTPEDGMIKKMSNENNPSQEKIHELQMIDQSLQNILMQKQSFQFELSETQSALSELENSSDEVFKMVGQLMIKTDKEKLKEELGNKEKFLDLRLKNLEKQEEELMGKVEKLRDEVVNENK